MNKIQLFEDRTVRTAWNEDEEEWYFSVVDVVTILTDSKDATTGRKYWNKLKQRLKTEGNELVTNCHQLKMTAADGKQRKTDVANTRDLLRIIQSIPSPKAEPFKMWLATTGAERLDEIADPEKAILRGADYYRAKGYSEGWINQRLQTIEMTKAWSGLSISEYKNLKGLKKENLRDNMTNIELVLNMVAEVTTTALSRQEKPRTFRGNANVAKRGGNVARNTRTDIENQLGQTVISSLNAQDKTALEITAQKPEPLPKPKTEKQKKFSTE